MSYIAYLKNFNFSLSKQDQIKICYFYSSEKQMLPFWNSCMLFKA